MRPPIRVLTGEGEPEPALARSPSPEGMELLALVPPKVFRELLGRG